MDFLDKSRLHMQYGAPECCVVSLKRVSSLRDFLMQVDYLSLILKLDVPDTF